MFSATPGSSQGIMQGIELIRIYVFSNIVIQNEELLSLVECLQYCNSNQFRRSHWGRMGSTDIAGFNNSQFNVEVNILHKFVPAGHESQ